MHDEYYNKAFTELRWLMQLHFLFHTKIFLTVSALRPPILTSDAYITILGNV